MPPSNETTPSQFSPLAIFGAFFGLVLGILIASIFLILKPTTTVDHYPETIDSTQVYYIPGSKTQPSYWKQMRYAFYSPKRIKITLQEDDLNRWASAALSIPSLPSNKEKMFAYGVKGAPNFRIENSQLHTALSFEILFVGEKIPVLFQTSGTFKETDWGFEYVPSSMHIGSMPIPKSLSSLVIDNLVLPAFAKKKEANLLKEAWQKLAIIEITDHRMQVARTE